MAGELEALLTTLRSGQTAKSGLPAMEEERAKAAALRQQPLAPIDQETGFMSPLQAIAGMIDQGKSTQKMRQLDPQIEAARQQVGASKAGLQEYGLRQAVEKEATRKSELESKNTALVKAAALQKQHALTLQENRAVNASDVYENRQEDDAAKLLLANVEAKKIRDAKAAAEKLKYDAEQAILNKTISGHKQAWNKKTNEPTQLAQDRTGGWINSGTREPIDPSQYTFSDPKKKVKGGKGRKGEDVSDFAKVAKPDMVSSILTDDLLGAGTGAFDPTSIMGKFGMGVPFMSESDEEGPRIQALQSRISDVGIDQVKTNLEGLGVNPTDKDLEVAFASIPQRDTQPIAWVEWTRDQYLPLIKKTYAKAVAEGDKSQTEMDAVIDQVERDIEIGAAKWAGNVDRPNEVNIEEVNANRERSKKLKSIRARQAVLRAKMEAP